MFENFPYTNFHDLNLDWIIKKVKEAYSPDNPPEYVVLSVNGETGDVILYRDAVVTLPDVQESQWNIHRLANGQSSGIQFIQGDKAQRIDGTHRYDMYDAGNPPPYPVRSVNGLTGAVTVVKTVNGDNGDVTLYPTAIVEFPDVSEDYFQVKRTAAGTDIGIEFDKNGPAKRLNDTDEYTIYDEGNPPPYPVTSVGTLTGAVAILDTSVVTDQGTQKLKIVFPVTTVDGQTGTVETWGYSDDENIKLPLEAEADIWSISREVPSGELGVRLTVNGLTDNPEGYLVLNDGTNTTALKILTPADIPSSSGVVSVNGANGVVILYGTDIAMSSTDSTSLKAAIEAVNGKTGADIPVSGTDPTKIDAALSGLTTAVNNNATSIIGLENAIAIVATNNTHAAITRGQFVYVKEHNTLTPGLYVATTNIAANATLSTSNLIADPSGGLNELEARFVEVSVDMSGSMTEKFQAVCTILKNRNYKLYRSYPVMMFISGSSFNGVLTGTFNNSDGAIRFLVADENHLIYGEFRKSDNTILSINDIATKMHTGTIIETFTNGTATIPFSDFGLTERPGEMVITPQSEIGCVTYDYSSSSSNIVLYGRHIDGTNFSGSVRFGYMCWQ